MESDQFSNFLIFLKLDKTPYIALQNRLGRKLFLQLYLKKTFKLPPKRLFAQKYTLINKLLKDVFKKNRNCHENIRIGG